MFKKLAAIPVENYQSPVCRKKAQYKQNENVQNDKIKIKIINLNV